ncbi:MAG: hypothetical protein VX733_01890 [Candidatus Latescibacterota bacterium]|nr:hypothetical protein [Candidatus Latescibacterota bacterium]
MASGKSILGIVLAMCGSFTIVLAVMGHMATTPRWEESRARRQAVVAPEDDLPVIAGYEPGMLTEEDPSPVLDVVIAAEDAARVAALDPFRDSGRPTDRAELKALARTVSGGLDGVRSALSRQVSVLKENRDQMLADFARELSAMPAGEAAEALAELDDELAISALSRIRRDHRKSIIERLPAKRQTRVDRGLRQLASR